MALPCERLHVCKPWGWRIVAGKRAHFFERVPDELALEVCASSSSVCGEVNVGLASEHWRAHPHAGVVPMCPKCQERLSLLSQP